MSEGKSIADLVHNHDLVIFGNPQNPRDQPGLVVKIDRLEQSMQKGFSRSWKINGVVVSGLVVLFEVLVKLLG